MSPSVFENPLLELPFRIPFDRIQASHAEPAITELIARARRRMEEIAGHPGPRTWENTMDAYDHLTEPVDIALGVLHHLESVATYPELREAYNRVQPLASAFYAVIPLDAGLWNAVREYAGTEEAQALTGERKRYLSKTLDWFRRHGAELDAEGKKRLEAIDVELATLSTRFSQNVLDSTNAFEHVVTDPAKLAGLPESAMAAARQSAARKGLEGWRFTLQAPDYIAVTTHLDDAEVRRAFYHAFSRRATEGAWDNRPLVERILQLRREKAQLLGFQDYADFALVDRMAHTGARALGFLEDLRDRSQARFQEENAELLAFRRRTEGPEAPELEPWDVAYYAEKQRKALYDFDEEVLRPYFPLERVVAGMFELAERLYGIRVQEEAGAPVWDAAVKYYTVHDADGTFIGGFYADWYPRENKRDGAWMDAFLTGGPRGETFRPHLGLICGNLTPPIGDRPALLKHREVETVFHEFGHLLHHLLSRVGVRSLAGTSVAWDFVELPSQIMENWCWEREAVDLLARHYQTGAGVPDELFARLRRTRTFRAANLQMRQLGFGFADLLLHVRYDAARDGDPIAYTRAVLQQFSPARLPQDHAMIAAFTHLFSGGYAAGYYSYKWAEVLDADAFTRFREHGIFSREAGLAFREHVLSRGDSEDPAELYRRFMGRDPDPMALLVRNGLAPGV